MTYNIEKMDFGIIKLQHILYPRIILFIYYLGLDKVACVKTKYSRRHMLTISHLVTIHVKNSGTELPGVTNKHYSLDAGKGGANVKFFLGTLIKKRNSMVEEVPMRLSKSYNDRLSLELPRQGRKYQICHQ